MSQQPQHSSRTLHSQSPPSLSHSFLSHSFSISIPNLQHLRIFPISSSMLLLVKCPTFNPKEIILQLFDDNQEHQKWSYTFEGEGGSKMDNMGMLDQKIFLYVDGGKDKVRIFDLESKEIVEMEGDDGRGKEGMHKWNGSNQYQIITFGKNMLFCVVQHLPKAQRTYLYYYKYTKTPPKCQLLSYFSINTILKGKFQKLDNNSKICWLTTQLKDKQQKWIFNFCEINGNQCHTQAAVYVGREEQFGKVLNNLHMLWQIEQNVYLVYPQFVQLQNKTGLMQLTINEGNATLQPLEYTFQSHRPYQKFPSLPLIFKHLKDNLLTLVFRRQLTHTSRFYNKSNDFWLIQQNCTIIVLDINQQKVIAVDQPDNKDWQTRMQGGKGNVENLLVKYRKRFDYHINHSYEIFVTSLTQVKDRYMQMLLHLYEDFDDDLLQDAMQLLLCQ